MCILCTLLWCLTDRYFVFVIVSSCWQKRELLYTRLVKELLLSATYKLPYLVSLLLHLLLLVYFGDSLFLLWLFVLFLYALLKDGMFDDSTVVGSIFCYVCFVFCLISWFVLFLYALLKDGMFDDSTVVGSIFCYVCFVFCLISWFVLFLLDFQFMFWLLPLVFLSILYSVHSKPTLYCMFYKLMQRSIYIYIYIYIQLSNWTIFIYHYYVVILRQKIKTIL